MRYTPGPWRMKNNGELWSHARGATPQLVASVSWMGDQEDRPGNMKVVEASVELTEAMDELYLLAALPQIAQAIQSDPAVEPKARLILDNAREILQKCTGRRVPDWRKIPAHANRLTHNS